MRRDGRDAPLRWLRTIITAFLFAVVWPITQGGRMMWFWLRGRG